MADPNFLDFLRVPSDALIALDNRGLHFALQPWHYLIRLVHIITMAGFFGGIGFLDFRLMGWGRALVLKPLVEAMLPLIYACFGLAMISGAALFFYDPVHVGSHAYFSLKLILIGLGVGNAILFHRTRAGRSLLSENPPPRGVRWAGAISVCLWTGVLVCAALNVEAAPKVLLQ